MRGFPNIGKILQHQHISQKLKVNHNKITSKIQMRGFPYFLQIIQNQVIPNLVKAQFN